VSRVVEAVAANRAAVSRPAADGVVVDGSAVVDVVVDEQRTDDGLMADEEAVVEAL